MNKILSIDPGKSCGYAVIEFGGKVLDIGKVNFAVLPELLDRIDWTDLVTIVYEEFIVRRSHSEHFVGSVMEVSQAIGVLSAYAKMHKVPMKKQQAYHFKLGAKYLGETLPKGHLSDEKSALYHGISYLKSIDQFQTKLEREMRANNG